MIKELNYTEAFGERLVRKRNSLNFPRSVLFEITYRCNLRCRHCCVVPAPDKRELTTSGVKSILKQLADAGCLHLTLTGGEPLLREDIFSLMDYARRIGLFIHLFTNATLITPEIADRLQEFQLISLDLSLHSLKKERFDWFTQVDGSFDKTMKAIELLRKRGLKPELKISITKANIDEIEDLKSFGKELGIIPEWTTLLMPRIDGSKDNLTLRLDPEQVIWAEAILLSDAEASEESPQSRPDDSPQKEETQDKLLWCQADKKSLVITPRGELRPCTALSLSRYSVLEGDLRAGWKKLGDCVESLTPGPEHRCFDCKLRSFCLSCPARAELECGDRQLCPDYYRSLAELNAQADEKILKEAGGPVC